MKPDSERIALLNRGEIETKNLMDGLAIDFHTLTAHVFPGSKMAVFPEKTGFIKRMQLTSQYLYQQYGFEIFDKLKAHNSDTIRSFACYVLVLHNLSIEKKFELITPLADDYHFGVREWAWIALRPEIIADPFKAIGLFEPWVLNQSENIRRFASESTRPRGVWCSHIKIFRQEPWHALTILEPLKNDPAKYVQLSVANWLNDAGKDHPKWVIQLCEKWQSKCSTNTEKICKRALRNLKF